MPRPLAHPDRLVLPREPNPDEMPIRYGSREQLADIHGHYYGPISHRTLERWPLRWRKVNGRAVAEVREFLAEAERRFREAPVIMSGQKAA
jgi:hypothetical protein